MVGRNGTGDLWRWVGGCALMVVGLAAGGACGAPSPNDPLYPLDPDGGIGEGGSVPNGESPTTPTSGAATGGSDQTGNAAPGDIPAGGDAGGTNGSSGPGSPKAAGGAGGIFAAAGPYVQNEGATSLQASHNFPSNTPSTSPAGQACMKCHGGSGPGPNFELAGTVYTDSTATTAADGVEIRIRAPGQADIVTFSDAYGNFFSLATGAALGSGATAGIRNASGSQVMASSPNGDCNSCHNPSMPIHL